MTLRSAAHTRELPASTANLAVVHTTVDSKVSMSALDLLQLVSGILLILVVLLQQRGTGLGSAFGGEGNVYRTVRGLEKTLAIATVVLAVIFSGAALAHVFA